MKISFELKKELREELEKLEFDFGLWERKQSEEEKRDYSVRCDLIFELFGTVWSFEIKDHPVIVGPLIWLHLYTTD